MRKTEKFYADINNAISSLICDLNIKMGRGAEGSVGEKYGVGIWKESGNRFVEFCCEHNKAIINSYFKLKENYIRGRYRVIH